INVFAVKILCPRCSASMSFWKVLYAINSAACEENGTYIGGCLLFGLLSATFCVESSGERMHPYRSTSSFTDVSNIVDLGHYRKARRLRSADLRRLPVRAAEKSSPDSRPHDDYRERMKVNAVVFIFLMLLISSGVWLLDGLSASFGPERL